MDWKAELTTIKSRSLFRVVEFLSSLWASEHAKKATVSQAFGRKDVEELSITAAAAIRLALTE